MTMEDQIGDTNIKYNINREAAKISALSFGKTDKYEYVTGEDMLPSNKQQINEQAKFTYSPLGKDFEKQTNIIEDQGENQLHALKSLKSLQPKEVKSEETKPIEYDDCYINKMAEIRDQ